MLTHCNAGWLATVDYGTALAPIYMAHDAGIKLHVWVDETRPRNQGAALTAFEVALAAARGEPGSPERSAWEDDATEFAAMQRALLLSFEGEGEACGQLKRWYALADTEYEGEIGREGHGVTPPAAEKEAMLRAYAASGKTRFC